MTFNRRSTRTLRNGCNADLVKQNLRDFRKVFHALMPTEQAEALQCMLNYITVYPEKLVLDVYELAAFSRASLNRADWLRQPALLFQQNSHVEIRVGVVGLCAALVHSVRSPPHVERFANFAV